MATDTLQPTLDEVLETAQVDVVSIPMPTEVIRTADLPRVVREYLGQLLDLRNPAALVEAIGDLAGDGQPHADWVERVLEVLFPPLPDYL